jgi:magnesium transporter
LLTAFVHDRGGTTRHDHVDPAWLGPGGPSALWVDLQDPTADEAQTLSRVFGFHELAIEDALAEIHHPKVESYGDYVYLILHGIRLTERRHQFSTQDIDFFLARNYLVTVHGRPSRSVDRTIELCERSPHVLAEGPAALMHRLVNELVDHYRPEVDKLHEQIDALERQVFEAPAPDQVRRMMLLKKGISSLRHVVMPQRDAIGRLARREFALIDEQLAYRFRDVYDSLVRIADEAAMFQDRLTGLLDAHLTSISNRLNSVMKVLTVIATIFMPLTVLTGMYGMNVPLPHLPGGEAAQFWWILAIMGALSAVMLWLFRRAGWL